MCVCVCACARACARVRARARARVREREIERGNTHRILLAEGLRLFQRPRHRWENNNIVDIGEVWDDSVNWIDLAEEV